MELDRDALMLWRQSLLAQVDMIERVLGIARTATLRNRANVAQNCASVAQFPLLWHQLSDTQQAALRGMEVETIMELYGISRRTAYRWREMAIKAQTPG